MSSIRTTLCLIGVIAIGATAQRFSTRTQTPKTAAIAKAPEPTAQASTLTTTRPSIDTVLTASRLELRHHLATFLPQATTDELEQLAEHWLSKDAAQPPSIHAWRLTLARWVELDPSRALAVERDVGIHSLQGWCYRVWS